MFSHFFIDRPIFASVLSVLITLTGGIALLYLPIAQYPQVTPPSVQVAITYPGASPPVVADTVAAPVEQQVNGIEGMLYMSSQMGTDGSYTLTVTFDLGTDLNTALVMVQNRVALAIPQLPTDVQNQGITIRKKTPDILNVVNFYSPDGRYDDIYLSNFATIYVKDELLRVEGVSDINYLGERDYSIRVWLNPQKLASLNLTAVDVATAIRNQNLDAPAGQVNQPPGSENQPLQLPINTLGRLTEPEQFGDIIVKVGLGPATPTPTSATPPTPANFGMPVPGAGGTSPSQGTTGGLTAAGMSGVESSSTSTTTGASSGTSGMPGAGTTIPTAGASATLGVSVTGGATSPGGGTTSTGTTTGGATVGSGTGATTATTLATTSGTTAAAGNGAISGEMLGRGGGRPAPGIVRLRDVGRIELGAENYNQACTFDGYPSVGLAIHMLPGTNALTVAQRVQAKMEELRARFPDGVDYAIAYDITPFVRESVADVVHTLFEAVGLVGVVVLVFLQNWRAALIPLIAVPVAIVGTFAVMAALGFSLNNISLFGLVLAIGIVVDDAIVVVENVERWLEQGLAPREATRRAMDEVTGPVIAVALVLSAVFVPCAFISGITGQFFRQFAVTISASTIFSALNSLTLSPALAAIVLRPRDQRRDPLTWLLDHLLGWFLRLFNRGFNAGTTGYAWIVAQLLRVNILVLLAYAALGFLTYWVFERAPTGFVPEQDQGRVIVSIELPDAASLARTQETVALVEKITRETPGVAHTVTMSGLSFVQQANSSNFASMFVVLTPFDQRRSPDLRDTAIMARLRREWDRQVKDGTVTVYRSAPIPGLSVTGGFKLMVEDRAGLGLPYLQRQTDALIGKLAGLPGLNSVATQFRSNTPQLFMDIDRPKVASLGIALQDVNQALAIYLGSLYVNSFNEFGRDWQVNVQAEGAYRSRVDDINLIEVRNNQGRMVPLGTLVNVREVGGPVMVIRYNLYTAAPVLGNLLPGASSGALIEAIDNLAGQTLPLNMKTEWTELMFMQIRAGDTAMYVFTLAVVCVFLALAALYESWSLPLAVILVVPLCLLCSIGGVLAMHMDVNIFVQIGLVVLVGLACKNSILIVEFARHVHEQGRPRAEATVEASRLRLRPILMTSFAFIFGVVPLVLASGAGAEMRRSLGTAVFSGMIGVTLFGIFLTPVFFYVIQGLSDTRLFRAPHARPIGTLLAGFFLGLLVGFALARLGMGRPQLTVSVGGGTGLLVAFLILQFARWRRSQPRRVRQ